MGADLGVGDDAVVRPVGAVRGLDEVLRLEAHQLTQKEAELLRREFGWPLAELGTIRLRMGDLEGAEEAFAAAHEHVWCPYPGMALVHLARGDVTTAMALIGDAAHTIHPLAGQGVNLGFLDAAVLAEVLVQAAERGERLAEVKVLSRYERRRMPHNLALMAAMEGFERLFQANPLPLRWLRNSGLKLVEQLPEAKALFVRQALGLSGDLPELARP